jgi:hypothetical protein
VVNSLRDGGVEKTSKGRDLLLGNGEGEEMGPREEKKSNVRMKEGEKEIYKSIVRDGGHHREGNQAKEGGRRRRRLKKKKEEEEKNIVSFFMIVFLLLSRREGEEESKEDMKKRRQGSNYNWRKGKVMNFSTWVIRVFLENFCS